MNLQSLLLTAKKRKIAALTCYDYWSAKLLAETDIDLVLVGDSCAMVMHGHSTTLPADVDIIALHVQAVAKGCPQKFIVADLPFLSYRTSLPEGVQAVKTLMQAGAHAVKLEGLRGNELFIQHIVESGVPVMGHLGLMPQQFHQLGGFRKQGKTDKAAENILLEAKKLEELGCFSIVLECIPEDLANKITQSLNIPSIGIGAGPNTSGQILILQDLLGLQPHFNASFVRPCLDGAHLFQQAINTYIERTRTEASPEAIECTQMT